MAGSRLLWPLGAMALFGASAVQAQPQLPEGPGKAVIEQACLGCHEPVRILNSGYSRQDWQNVVHMMLNVGAPVPPDQVAGLTDYLAKNFPEKPKPAPSLITGSAHVEIKEWMVPTPGSRPHDPLAYPDGSIWYTGHMANLLGRLDPHSGKITEYHPDTPSSGPHGLVADRDGNIWFTGNFAGYIGKFDPKSGKFTNYPLPDPNARDPHTPLFDRRGMLWFTVQGANMVGRLDPEDRRDQAGEVADAAVEPVRHGGQLARCAVVLRIRRQQAGQHRSRDHGDPRIRAAERGKPAAAHRHHAGRCHLVRGLCPRLSRPVRYEDGRGEGIRLAWRAEFAALRHRLSEASGVVQRIRRAPEYAGAVRSRRPRRSRPG